MQNYLLMGQSAIQAARALGIRGMPYGDGLLLREDEYDSLVSCGFVGRTSPSEFEGILIVEGEMNDMPRGNRGASTSTLSGNARDRYIQLCSGRLPGTVIELEQKIATARQSVADLRQKLLNKERELSESQTRLAGIQARTDATLKRFGDEFDRLEQNPKIKEIAVNDDYIQIFTAMIYCVDPRTQITHEIGEFRIDLPIGGGVPSFTNLTGQIYIGDYGDQRMQAPHVDGSGHPCLGNTQDTFPGLLADYQFAQAAVLAIQFLESVNVDDSWGRYISKWPQARR